MAVAAVMLALGWWLRTLGPLNLTAAVAWPWASATITLYYVDGPYLFPLSRRVAADADLPRTALEALLAGPPIGSGLTSALPPGLAVESLAVTDGTAHVRLTGPADALHDAPLGVPAIVATLTRVPDVIAVAVDVNGVPLTQAPARAPLLYYPAGRGLVALPASAADPRAALVAFLAGPPSPELTRLPSDARLLGAELDRPDGVVSLRFAYTPAVRALALERPDRMRLLLLGLIATLTGYPEVRAVQLDFGGQSRLGLGECSDLLRTPQPRPALLNDERLLQ
jgi:spore germination protein GerM